MTSSLLSVIKAWLYQLLVRSHILYYLTPVLMPLGVFVLRKICKTNTNKYEIVDAKGHIINASKYKDRLYPQFFIKQEKFSSTAIRDTDVLLCGYPKTGCHWMHEILTMLVNRKAELSKYGKALGGMIEFLPNVLLDSLPSPRVLNSHFRFEELPSQVAEKQTKIVLTVRNPKDTAVSFYNHVHKLPNYDYHGEFDDFFDLYMAGELEYGSYFDYMLDWDKHITSEAGSNILVVKFEDLKSNIVQEIKRIAHFLKLEVTDDFADEVARVSSFNKMKESRSATPFEKIFRRGAVGDWRNWLTDKQSAAIDNVWQERMMACTYQPQYN